MGPDQTLNDLHRNARKLDRTQLRQYLRQFLLSQQLPAGDRSLVRVDLTLDEPILRAVFLVVDDLRARARDAGDPMTATAAAIVLSYVEQRARPAVVEASRRLDERVDRAVAPADAIVGQLLGLAEQWVARAVSLREAELVDEPGGSGVAELRVAVTAAADLFGSRLREVAGLERPLVDELGTGLEILLDEHAARLHDDRPRSGCPNCEAIRRPPTAPRADPRDPTDVDLDSPERDAFERGGPVVVAEPPEPDVEDTVYPYRDGD